MSETFWDPVAPHVYSHQFEPFGVNGYAMVTNAGVLIVDSGNNPEQAQQLLDHAQHLLNHAQHLLDHAVRLQESTTQPLEPATQQHAATQPTDSATRPRKASTQPVDSSGKQAKPSTNEPGAVVGLVLTHAHHDHCFGSSAFAARDIPVIAHSGFNEHLYRHGVRELQAYREGRPPQGISAGLWDRVAVVSADYPIHGSMPLKVISQLGIDSPHIELHALGPAHTTADLIVHNVDSGVWIVGDLVEESGPPQIEADSDIRGWVAALDWLLRHTGPNDVILPGHGKPVNREYVARQRDYLHALTGSASTT